MRAQKFHMAAASHHTFAAREGNHLQLILKESVMPKSLWISAVCLALTVGVAARPQAPVELKEGDKAPDFSLPGTDGQTHKLSDYKGKTVVLAWFPKAFTGG
jgi:hypothetical protein